MSRFPMIIGGDESSLPNHGPEMVDHRALEIEADRILDALGKAGLTLRLVGSMAILQALSEPCLSRQQ